MKTYFITLFDWTVYFFIVLFFDWLGSYAHLPDSDVLSLLPF